MKARKSRPERLRSLSQLLNRRLVSYATAATAAGAGLLGLARPAEAQIVYTPAHVVIGFQGSYALDLTNDGTTDFILHDSAMANCSTAVNALLAQPVPGNAVEGRSSANGLALASALKAGNAVGSSQHFINPGGRGAIMGEAVDSPGGGSLFGNWIHAANRYLGLKFQINGQTYFGWARMTVDVSRPVHVRAVLSGYAYETQPNTAIIAGQEHGAAAGVPSEPWIKGQTEGQTTGESGPDASLESVGAPQPASLGMLALGAAGLAWWRREPPAPAL